MKMAEAGCFENIS